MKIKQIQQLEPIIETLGQASENPESKGKQINTIKQIIETLGQDQWLRRTIQATNLFIPIWIATIES